MLQILYLAQDLADPAVRRRTLTLVAGGARVTLAGFRRGDNPLAAIDGVEPIELGTTADGRFAQRIGAVARACLSLQRQLGHVRKPDVIIARNLEMLAVARRAVAFFGGTVPIVYECLDIHRLMLRKDIVGRMLRAAESQLGKNARLLITSSPAFIEHYFRPLSGIGAPPMLLENKVLEIDGTVERRTASPAECPPPGAPWKIGWFGALRCRRSLALLAEFSRRTEGRFEIVLRGRPAYSEFDDFDGFVRNEPFMRFEGAYRNPEDLAEIYGEVHFTWAIDFFEEGQILPGCCRTGFMRLPPRPNSDRHEGTETVASCPCGASASRSRGSRPREPRHNSRPADAKTLCDAAERISRCNPGSWVFDRADCETLVRQLAGSRSSARRPFGSRDGRSSHNEGGFL